MNPPIIFRYVRLPPVDCALRERRENSSHPSRAPFKDREWGIIKLR
jgi:hypothetical protein